MPENDDAQMKQLVWLFYGGAALLVVATVAGPLAMYEIWLGSSGFIAALNYKLAALLAALGAAAVRISRHLRRQRGASLTGPDAEMERLFSRLLPVFGFLYVVFATLCGSTVTLFSPLLFPKNPEDIGSGLFAFAQEVLFPTFVIGCSLFIASQGFRRRPDPDV